MNEELDELQSKIDRRKKEFRLGSGRQAVKRILVAKAVRALIVAKPGIKAKDIYDQCPGCTKSILSRLKTLGMAYCRRPSGKAIDEVWFPVSTSTIS